MGAFVAAIAFMAVAGHMMKVTPVAPATPAAAASIDYGMLANAIQAARPATVQAAAPVAAPAKAAPVKAAPVKRIKHKAAPAARVVYVLPHSCSCAL